MMNDAVIPYTLPEVRDHSFFFIAQHVRPEVEARMHRHEGWELYYVTKGHGLRMAGDNVMEFAEGDVVLIPPSMPHYWEYRSDRVDVSGEITYLMVAFSPDFIEKLKNSFPEIRRTLYGRSMPREALRYGNASSSVIRQSLKRMAEIDDISRLSEMIKLLPFVFTTPDRSMIGRPIKIERDIMRMQQVVTYVMAHYPRKITLDEIASHIGMNRSAFCSFFRRSKGMTFTQFLTAYRLETACGLLLDSRRQISEICYAVGFNDLPHFNRVFKNHFGITPSAFRKAKASQIPL